MEKVALAITFWDNGYTVQGPVESVVCVTADETIKRAQVALTNLTDAIKDHEKELKHPTPNK